MAIKKTILVVEDEAAFLEALSYKLKQEGFNVVEASDAISATVIAKQQKPDLILLDYSMPAGSGGDVFRRLREVFNELTPPVLFISAFPLETIKRDLPEWVNIGYMAKPLDYDKLLDAIHSLLRIRPAAGQPKADLDLDAE